MIPVELKKEPQDFDEKVRKPGLAWLNEQEFFDSSIPVTNRQRVPEKTEFPACWRKCAKQLFEAYDGICAYLSVKLFKITGDNSVDHFLPKTLYPGQAYEWSNYRLSSLGVNRTKSTQVDILDPFEIEPDTFRIEIVTGKIYPSPTAPQEKAVRTIKVLHLDDQDHRDSRCNIIQDYLDGLFTLEYCRRNYPFIHSELIRQNIKPVASRTPLQISVEISEPQLADIDFSAAQKF